MIWLEKYHIHYKFVETKYQSEIFDIRNYGSTEEGMLVRDGPLRIREIEYETRTRLEWDIIKYEINGKK